MIKMDNSELNLKYSLRADYIRKMNPSVEKTASLKSFIIDIEKDILGIAGYENKYFVIEEILPDHYREITIEKDLEKGFDYRKITITER